MDQVGNLLPQPAKPVFQGGVLAEVLGVYMIPPSRWRVEDRIRLRSRLLVSNGCESVLHGKWQSGLSRVMEGVRLFPRLLEDPNFYMPLGYGLRPLGYRGPGMDLPVLDKSVDIYPGLRSKVERLRRTKGRHRGLGKVA